jgi:hypothetical protein
MTSTIVNANGQFQSATGPEAVRAFGLRVLASGLKLEIKCPGLKMSRVSALAQAKQVTGLRTNSRALQLAAVELLLADAVSKCAVVTREQEIADLSPDAEQEAEWERDRQRELDENTWRHNQEMADRHV